MDNTITLNEWQFVVAAWNGLGSPRLYRNGVEVSYKTQIVGASPVDDAVTSLTIGGRATGSTENFNSVIDDVRVYNRALSQDEVKRLYNMGR